MFKTKKARSAALALVTTAAVWASGAAAQVDVNAGTADPATFASELAFPGTATTLTLTHPGVLANLTITIDATSTAQTRYVRYDLSGGGAAFGGTAPTVTIPGASVGVVDGGTTGETFAIYAVTVALGTTVAEATTGADVNISMGSVPIRVSTLGENVTVTVSIFETQTLATANTSPLGTVQSAGLVDYASGINTTITPANLTADVATGFLRFLNVADNVYASLGSIAYAPVANVFDADGTPITLADLRTAATLVITGDFGFAANPTGTAFVVGDGDVQLNGANPTALTATTATFNLVTAMGGAFNVRTQMANTGLLVNSTYEAAINFTAATLTTGGNAGVSLANRTGSFGTVMRNGTNVDIPYITTFDSYNQRIILVNRSATAATYAITFTPEAGVTATAGTSASGTLAANQTLVLRTTDVVTITGGTRTAGHVSIVAQSGSIDVATTQVNLSDASTDTVVLQ